MRIDDATWRSCLGIASPLLPQVAVCLKSETLSDGWRRFALGCSACIRSIRRSRTVISSQVPPLLCWEDYMCKSTDRVCGYPANVMLTEGGAAVLGVRCRCPKRFIPMNSPHYGENVVLQDFGSVGPAHVRVTSRFQALELQEEAAQFW